MMNLGEEYRQPLIDEVCRFVRIPSRSSARGGEEGELQQLVADCMRSAGARVRTFEPGDIPEFRRHPLCCGPDRQYEGRPTVLGELGPVEAPALLLLAHSDTVQITDPESWTFDPFCGEVREGKICGLGSSDDKWGVAALLTLMRAVQGSNQPLNRKLIFASTIDEENGVGNGTLLLTLAGLRAESALYLDGMHMQVFIGNLGGSNLYLRPNAILTKDRLSQHTRLLEEACQQLCVQRAARFSQPFFDDNIRKEKSIVLYQRSDETGPFFLIAFYTVPGEDRAGLCRELERAIGGALGNEISCYDLSYREPWFEPGITSGDIPLVGYLAEAIRKELGREPHLTTIVKQDRFVLTNHAGIPTVSFGPRSSYSEISGRGANHQPDEYISVEELWQGCRIAYTTVCRWLQA